MPNGADKNFRRLVATIAAYHERFKDWPTEVRVAPWAIWSLAQLLDLENFEKLGNRVRLGTTLRTSFAAGSSRGRVLYESMQDGPTYDSVQAAEAWLGVRVRPEFLHTD